MSGPNMEEKAEAGGDFRMPIRIQCGTFRMVFIGKQLMIGLRRLAAMGAAVSVVWSILGPNPVSAEALRPQAKAHAHVYLLRSFMNVFSSGIYDLAANVRSQGIYATVHTHFEWPLLAEQAARNYREGWEDPIIIIGHSSGADAAVSMAYRLAEAGVPTKLIVTLEPVANVIAGGSRDHVVKVNIFSELGVPVARGQSIGDRLVNLELKNRKVWPAVIDRSSPTLDQLILGYVFEAVAQGPARGSPSARVSGRVHGRVAAPAADARSHSGTVPRHGTPALRSSRQPKPSSHGVAA
jgi:hypothetical protein